MPDAILLVLGAFVGGIVFEVPQLWVRGDTQLDKTSFKATYPKRIGIYYLYALFPLVWLGVYLTIIFPIGATRLGVGYTYFTAYLALGGFGVLDGVVELATGIAPIRNGRGSLRLTYLVVHDSVRQVGLIRLGLFCGVGVVSWLLMYILT